MRTDLHAAGIATNINCKLLEAADFVERIDPTQFDLRVWWVPKGKATLGTVGAMMVPINGPCGCAVGHMAESGRFGIRTDELVGSFFECAMVRVKRAFRINEQQFNYMFLPDSYASPPSPAAVAVRMREVARGEFA